MVAALKLNAVAVVRTDAVWFDPAAATNTGKNVPVVTAVALMVVLGPVMP